MRSKLIEPPSSDLIARVARAPGLCSERELQCVASWLRTFNRHLSAYREVFGEPTGHSVESRLAVIDYHLALKQGS